MKKLSILMLSLVAIIGNVNAQKAEAQDLTLEATLNLQVGGAPISFEVSEIRMRYFITSKLALRTRFAFDLMSSTDYVYNPMDPTVMPFTLESSASNFNLGLGIEKHFTGTDKLSPYIGAEVGFGISNSQVNGINTYNGMDYSAGSSFSAETSGAAQVYGGLVFGADYYIVPHLYIGAELAYGIAYQSLGERTIYNSYSGTLVKNTLGNSVGFGLQANPGVRIGLKF